MKELLSELNELMLIKKSYAGDTREIKTALNTLYSDFANMIEILAIMKEIAAEFKEDL